MAVITIDRKHLSTATRRRLSNHWRLPTNRSHPSGVLRFYRLALSLVLILALPLAFAIWRGDHAITQPSGEKQFNALFTDPLGEPCSQTCLFGIEPGTTTMQRAAGLLRVHPFLRGFATIGDGTFYQHADSQVILTRDIQTNGVSQIMLVSTADFSWGDLGTILADMGTPERVEVDPQYSMVIYEGGHLGFVHSHRIPDRLGPHDPLTTIILSAGSLTAPIGWARPGVPGNWSAWLGFAKLDRYPAPNAMP